MCPTTADTEAGNQTITQQEALIKTRLNPAAVEFSSSSQSSSSQSSGSSPGRELDQLRRTPDSVLMEAANTAKTRRGEYIVAPGMAGHMLRSSSGGSRSAASPPAHGWEPPVSWVGLGSMATTPLQGLFPCECTATGAAEGMQHDSRSGCIALCSVGLAQLAQPCFHVNLQFATPGASSCARALRLKLQPPPTFAMLQAIAMRASPPPIEHMIPPTRQLSILLGKDEEEDVVRELLERHGELRWVAALGLGLLAVLPEEQTRPTSQLPR